MYLLFIAALDVFGVAFVGLIFDLGNVLRRLCAGFIVIFFSLGRHITKYYEHQYVLAGASLIAQ